MAAVRVVVILPMRMEFIIGPTSIQPIAINFPRNVLGVISP